MPLDKDSELIGSMAPSQEPVKNPTLIAPLPPVGPQSSPDAIRQYYLNSIPQFRTFPLNGNLLGGVGSVAAGTPTGTGTTVVSGTDVDPYMHWNPLVTITTGGGSNASTRATAKNGTYALATGPQSTTITPGTVPLAGDLLFVAIQYSNSNFLNSNSKGEPARTVTDNVGNLWVEVAHSFNPNGQGSADIGEGMSLWCCLNAASSTPTITATLDRSGTPFHDEFWMGVWYSDITGVKASAVDTTSTGFTNASTATPTVPSFNTTTTDFIFASFSLFGVSGTSTPGTGYTSNFTLQSFAFNGFYADEYAQNVPAGAQSPFITANGSKPHWMYLAVALKTQTTATQVHPSFVVNDVFRYQGIEYICIADNPSPVVMPDTPGWQQYWQIVCAGTQDDNVNIQTGATYSILDADFSKLLYFNSGSAIAVNLPQAGTNYQFNAGWWCYAENNGVGLVTIAPAIGTIDGNASVVLSQNQGVIIFTDGVNYYTFRCLGTVTHTTGGLTNHAVILGNGAGDIRALSSLGTTTTVLHGNAGGDPSFGSVVEADISLSDVTTDNVSITAHGFAPKAPNDATKFLDGTGVFSVPGGSAPSGSGNKIYATPADGSSGTAALRVAVVNDYKFHSESLTDGASNFIFAAGDIVTVVGVPN